MWANVPAPILMIKFTQPPPLNSNIDLRSSDNFLIRAIAFSYVTQALQQKTMKCIKVGIGFVTT